VPTVELYEEHHYNFTPTTMYATVADFSITCVIILSLRLTFYFDRSVLL